jgi:peptide deformylase
MKSRSVIMAIRNIRKDGDEVLRKRSREVDEINDKILVLLKDMADTMYMLTELVLLRLR